jgi:hypothetical protein
MRNAEFDHIHHAFTRMSMAWQQIGCDLCVLPDSGRVGSTAHSAYAFKMSTYFEEQVTHCQELYHKVKQSPLAQQTNLHEPY